MTGAPDPKLAARAEALERIAQQEPDDASTWYGLGRAYTGLGRSEDALRAFERALELRPHYSAAHRELGRALLEAGRPAEAAAALERGIAVAHEAGDLQTAREMQTFLKRARRKTDRSEA